MGEGKVDIEAGSGEVMQEDAHLELPRGYVWLEDARAISGLTSSTILTAGIV